MTLRRAIGRFDATLLVIGAIIGAGIFINPYIVARRLESPALVLAAWSLGGVLAMAGALTYAELGSLRPDVGGQYAYLRDAFHPLVGFLYGWALLTTIESGAVAAVAITFAEYTLRLVGRPGAPALPLAITAIVVVSVVNVLGVKPGSRLLDVFVLLKVAALGVLIVAGFVVAGTSAASAAAAPGAVTAGGSTVVAIGAALVPILFSYGGWQCANYVAGEVRDPRRDLPASLLLGTFTVVVLYVAINRVYLRALGLPGLAATMTPASDSAARMFGPAGERFVAAAIAVSTFGFLDLAVLAPTRVYYAMAADGLFVPALARLHPRFRTPAAAIVAQSGWAVVLASSGTYAGLLDSVVFADAIFFGLSAATLFVFRRRQPAAERPAGSFGASGYPLVPALFVLAVAGVVASVVRAAPERAALGALLLAAGIPVFFWFRRRPATVS